jgi:D-xylose 1-dehydrogenase (NADP+, D-xylono-1,5-lactone-forming)
MGANSLAGMIRWGVLGARSWIAREAVMPAIRSSSNGRLAALASRDPQELKTLDDLSDGVRVLTYEGLIADDSVDAIYIPLPNSMHFEWAMKAAEAGKSVLCEKPLGIDAEEVETLADAFAQRGLKLMEGFMYRFHPQHRRVRELIDSGAIGDVLEVRAHLSVDLMSPPDPDNVRFRPELGGGALLDMGCYGVSAARMIFNDEPSAVSAWRRVDERFGVDVAAAGILEFSMGRVAMVSCSFEANGNGFYTAIGRNGMIEAPRALILGAGTRVPEALIAVVDGDGRRREEVLQSFNQYRALVEAFADSLLLDRPVPLPPSDSVNNARALDAFARSAAEGRKVLVSPPSKTNGDRPEPARPGGRE